MPIRMQKSRSRPLFQMLSPIITASDTPVTRAFVPEIEPARIVAQQHAERGKPDDHPDQEHHKTGRLRRNERAQARPELCQHDLDQSGEDGHAPDQRQAAELARRASDGAR